MMYSLSLTRQVQYLLKKINYATSGFSIYKTFSFSSFNRYFSYCLETPKFLSVYPNELYSKRFANTLGIANKINKEFYVNKIISKFSSDYYDVLKKSKHLSQEVLGALQKSINQVILYENDIQELTVVQKEESDSKFKVLMKEEIEELTEKVSDLKEELFSQLLENFSEQNIEEFYLEINAGVGGQEAMLFAQDLMSMYNDYCFRNGWNAETVSSENTTLGGIRHVCMLIKGMDSYTKLKYESGIHRVQRVPETEKGGRIHTSTASVAILPIPPEINIQLPEKDLKIDFMRASGPGGQNVNKSNSAVRVTHLPTGIVVECQVGKTQEGNKKEALRKLRVKLYEIETDKQISNVSFQRKLQTGTKARSEKIRTYNFVQDRVTDHRVGLSVHDIENVMAGGTSLEKLTTELMKIGKLEKIREILSIRDER